MKLIEKLIRKGLMVEAIDGKEEVFIINNVNDWIKAIKKVKGMQN